MRQIDPLDAEFEIMCFVKDQRAVKGSCTYDDAVKKFGAEKVRALISDGMIAQTPYGMLDWTFDGTKSMEPQAIARRIYKQVLREKGQIE
jgi:hypothetical protein